MSVTVRVNASLQVGSRYASRPSSFLGTLTNDVGPAPGNVLCSIHGTLIDLSQLTIPGYTRIQNLDPTNFVEVGVWDTVTAVFYPIDELLPGETYIRRLSRNLGGEEGTGTIAATGATRLMVKANTAACNVLVEAFSA